MAVENSWSEAASAGFTELVELILLVLLAKPSVILSYSKLQTDLTSSIKSSGGFGFGMGVPSLS